VSVAQPLPPESADEEQLPGGRDTDSASTGPGPSEELERAPVYSRLVPRGLDGGTGFSYLLLSIDDTAEQDEAARG
jgi:hypothetical protein